MTSSNRVFITGLSALTPAGDTLEKTWNALLAGETHLSEISQWDLSSWSRRLGGELKDFQAAKMLPDRKLIKVISRQDAIGINAAVQAIEHSGLISYRDGLDSSEQFNDETAIYVGSPGNKYFQQYDFLGLLSKTTTMQEFAGQLFNEVHPMWLLRILPNNVLAYTGITYGFKGPNHNVTNHAVGGTQALLEAYYAIKHGQAARAVVVAYDIGIEPQALFYYDKLGVISARHLKPFDKDHDGTILAEGAAALILESETSVQARSATCYGEIVGGLSASEGQGLFSLAENGQALAQLITQTLVKEQIKAEEITLLTAHGNGNLKSDNSEALAIDAVFGQSSVPVTGFKWSMGHTLCASGVVDTVLTALALKEQIIPGIANFTQADTHCKNLNIAAEARPLKKGGYAMVLNRGFASMNACVVVKGCE